MKLKVGVRYDAKEVLTCHRVVYIKNELSLCSSRGENLDETHDLKKVNVSGLSTAAKYTRSIKKTTLCTSITLH